MLNFCISLASASAALIFSRFFCATSFLQSRFCRTEGTLNFGKIKYYGFPKLGFQSCLVVGCERVDDDGDGECEDEDAGDGGEAADELAEVRPGVGCRDEIET